MGWGLLQGLGQGLQDTADIYGQYQKQKRLEKKYDEKIVGYTEEGQPVTQGEVSSGEYDEPLFGKLDRPKDKVFYNPKNDEYYTAQEPRSPNDISEKELDLRNKKKAGDAALKKMQAKRKRHLEDLKQQQNELAWKKTKYKNEQQSPSFGLLNGDPVMVPKGEDLPEGARLITEDAYNDRMEVDDPNRGWVTNENGDKVWTERKPGTVSYAKDDSNDDPSGPDVKRVLRAGEEAFGEDFSLDGWNVSDKPTEGKVKEFNRILEANNMDPVTIETDPGEDEGLGYFDKPKWRFVPEGGKTDNSKPSKGSGKNKKPLASFDKKDQPDSKNDSQGNRTSPGNKILLNPDLVPETDKTVTENNGSPPGLLQDGKRTFPKIKGKYDIFKKQG